MNRREAIATLATAPVAAFAASGGQCNEPDKPWIEHRLARLRRWCDNVLISPQDGVGFFWIKFYTPRYQYVINVRKHYIGGSVSSRLPRDGETWTRGNDLADGDNSPETWDRIMADIVSYELV